MTDELWDLYEPIAEELGWKDNSPWPWEEQVWDYFTAGECHGLALSIHYRTGWPIWFMSNAPEHEYHSPDGQGCGHVIVEHPSGEPIDIGGLTTWDEMVQNWSAETYPYMFRLEPHQFASWHEPDMGKADLFAEAILAHLGVLV